MSGKPWTEGDANVVRALYPNTRSTEIAQLLNRTAKSVEIFAWKNGLLKARDYFKAISASAKWGTYARPALKERFESKVRVTPGCWIWEGWKRSAYGGIKTNGKSDSAHRIAYELYVGPIPDGLIILHKCDNPECVNPDHLRVGTYQENTIDMYQKGRDRFSKMRERHTQEVVK